MLPPDLPQVLLHLAGWGINIYIWDKFAINFRFIFEVRTGRANYFDTIVTLALELLLFVLLGFLGYLVQLVQRPCAVCSITVVLSFSSYALLHP